MSEATTPYPCDTHDPYEVPRVRGVKVPVDTGTLWAMKPVATDESLDQITPEALQWAAEQMREHVERLVGYVFDWIVSEIPNVGPGAIAFTMAEAGMSCGQSVRHALDDLLVAAERHMCPEPDNPDCYCGACSYATQAEQEHQVAKRLPCAENDAVMAL